MRILLLLLLAGLRLGAQNIIQYTPAYGPASDVAALPDNSVIVLAAGGPQLPEKVVLHRVAANGDVVWSEILATSGSTTGTDMIQTADGSVVVLVDIEYLVLPDLERHLGLFKYDPDGNLVWSHEYEPALQTYGSDLLELSNGDLVITGSAWTTEPLPDYFFARLDADGNVLYEKIWGDATGIERMFAAAEAPDGGFFLAGTDGNDLTWSKTDGDAEVLWTEMLGTSLPVQIQRLDDGYVLVTRATYDNQSFPYLIRTDAAGAVLWNYAEVPGGSTPTPIYSVLPTANNGLLVVGGVRDSVAPFHVYPYWFMLDAQGELVWKQVFALSSQTGPVRTVGSFRGITRMIDGDYTLVGRYGIPTDPAPDEMIILFGAVDSTVSTAVPALPGGITVYPNPAVDGRFCWQLHASPAPVDIELVSVAGSRQLLRDQPACGCWEMRGMSPGMYFIEFWQNNRTSGRGKLLYRP